EGVVARAADQNVVAVAAVGRKLDRVRGQTGRLHHVVAGQGAHHQLVVGGFRAGDVHLRGQAEDTRPGRVADHLGHVVAAGAVDDDGVGRSVSHAATRGGSEVEVDLGHVRAGEVVDGDGVRAALGGEVDALDAVEVHRHAGHVAEEPNPAAIGTDV